MQSILNLLNIYKYYVRIHTNNLIIKSYNYT